MKKKRAGVILITILAILTVISSYYKIIPNVNADSGFDSSYDSGSSSSSSDWSSSSSDWDSDSSDYWGSGSSGDADDAIFLIGVILIIIIICVAANYIKAPKEQNLQLALDHSKEMSDEEIKKIIPDYSKAEFLKERYADYLEVQRSWTEFDYESIRRHVTDELYNQYSMQLDTLKVKNQKNILSDFIYKDAMVTSVKNENNQVTVTMELITEFYDYIEQNGSVVRGNKNNKITMHYEITFVTNLTNKVDTCPNCGAKLEKGASKTCEYCGSVISSVSDTWVMSKKEAKKQR